MSYHRQSNCGRIVLRTIFCIAIGVLTGYLFLEHFYYARSIFWISFGIGAGMLGFLMLRSILGRSNVPLRCARRHLPCVITGVLGTLTTSIAAISIAVSHNIPNAVIFGADIGFLSFLLLSAIALVSCEQLRYGDAESE